MNVLAIEKRRIQKKKSLKTAQLLLAKRPLVESINK